MLHVIRRQLGSLRSAASSRLARATSCKPTATGLLTQATITATPAAGWHQATLMRLLSIGRGSDKREDGLDLARSKPQQQIKKHASKQIERSAPATSNVNPHSASVGEQSKRPRTAASPSRKQSWETRRAAEDELNGQLRQCLRSRDAPHAIDLLRQYNEPESPYVPTNHQYSRGVNVLTGCKRHDLIAEIQTMMKAADVTPNSHIYSGFMKCYIECDLPEKAIILWAQLRSDRIKLDPACYSAAMTAYAKAGRLKDAQAVFDGMQQDGVVPHEQCYGAMMNAHAEEGQYTEAEKLVDAMKTNGLSVNATCYGALMKAYVAGGKPEKALAVFYSLEVNVLQEVILYNTSIDACSHLEDLPQARSILQMMLDRSIKPTVITYGSMIDVCSSVGDWQAAEKYFKEMISKRFKPGVQTYSILIRVCGEGGHCDKAKLWFDAVPAAGLKHCLVSYGMMINAYTKAQRYSEADEMYQRMLRMRILNHWNPEKPGQMDLHKHSYGTALASTRLVFSKLCGSGIRKDGHVHDIRHDLRIITGHAKKRALYDGSIVQQSILKWLQEQGIQCSIDSDGGRVVVSSAELQAYVARQQTTAATTGQSDTTH